MRQNQFKTLISEIRKDLHINSDYIHNFIKEYEDGLNE